LLNFEIDLKKEKEKYFVDYDRIRSQELGAQNGFHHRRQLSENRVHEIKNETYDRIVRERNVRLTEAEKQQILVQKRFC
jgi:hypothetical protein